MDSKLATTDAHSGLPQPVVKSKARRTLPYTGRGILQLKPNVTRSQICPPGGPVVEIVMTQTNPPLIPVPPPSESQQCFYARDDKLNLDSDLDEDFLMDYNGASPKRRFHKSARLRLIDLADEHGMVFDKEGYMHNLYTHMPPRSLFF